MMGRGWYRVRSRRLIKECDYQLSKFPRKREVEWSTILLCPAGTEGFDSMWDFSFLKLKQSWVNKDRLVTLVGGRGCRAQWQAGPRNGGQLVHGGKRKFVDFMAEIDGVFLWLLTSLGSRRCDHPLLSSHSIYYLCCWAWNIIGTQ